MRVRTFVIVNLLMVLCFVVPVYSLLEYDFNSGSHAWCCCVIGVFRDGIRKLSPQFIAFIFWQLLTMVQMLFSFKRFEKTRLSFLLAIIFPAWFVLIYQRGYCFTSYAYTVFSILFCCVVLILCLKNHKNTEVEKISDSQKLLQLLVVGIFVLLSVFLENGYVKGAIDYITPRIFERKRLDEVTLPSAGQITGE